MGELGNNFLCRWWKGATIGSITTPIALETLLLLEGINQVESASIIIRSSTKSKKYDSADTKLYNKPIPPIYLEKKRSHFYLALASNLL